MWSYLLLGITVYGIAVFNEVLFVNELCIAQTSKLNFVFVNFNESLMMVWKFHQIFIQFFVHFLFLLNVILSY